MKQSPAKAPQSQAAQDAQKLLALGQSSWAAQYEVLRNVKYQLENWRRQNHNRVCDDANEVPLALFQLDFSAVMECLTSALSSSVPRVIQSAIECLNLLVQCCIGRGSIRGQEEGMESLLRRIVNEGYMNSDNATSHLLLDTLQTVIHAQSVSVNTQLLVLLTKRVLASPSLFASTTCLRCLQTIISLHPGEIMGQSALMNRLLEVVHYCVMDKSAPLLRLTKDLLLQCAQYDRKTTAQAIRSLQACKRAVVVEWMVEEKIDDVLVQMVNGSSKRSEASPRSEYSIHSLISSNERFRNRSVLHSNDRSVSHSNERSVVHSNEHSVVHPNEHSVVRSNEPALTRSNNPSLTHSNEPSLSEITLSRPLSSPIVLSTSILSHVQSRIRSPIAEEAEKEVDVTHEDIAEPGCDAPQSATTQLKKPSDFEKEALLREVSTSPSTDVLLRAASDP